MKEIFKTKRDLWKRKALDLTARSPLLNAVSSASGSKAMLIEAEDPDDFYKNRILSGEPFNPVQEHPDTKAPVLQEDPSVIPGSGSPDAAGEESSFSELFLPPEEALQRWNKIRRNANDYILQCGANALYASYGMLRWQEEEESNVYLAPILMVPVHIKKVRSEYHAVYRKEPVFLNAALTEMLKLRFDLESDRLREWVNDETGELDSDEVFGEFEDLVLNQDHLSVERFAAIGVYQYSQYLLWNDLDKHFDLLTESPLTEGIVTGVLNREFIEILNRDTDNETVLTPVEADSSQMQAVKAAMQGKSFVLHGPPGTGKSQTISLIIADLMNTGRSMLFAAEKAPALQVVYDRLKKIGLSRYCLYLPAVQKKNTDKEFVLKELAELLQPGDSPWDPSVQEELEKMTELEEQISSYIRTLHGKLVCGYSAYELLNEYLKYEEVPFGLDHSSAAKSPLSEKFITTLNEEQIRQFRTALETLCRTGKKISSPKNFPLKDWGNYKYVPHMQDSLRPLLEDYTGKLKLCLKAILMLREKSPVMDQLVREKLPKGITRENTKMLLNTMGAYFPDAAHSMKKIMAAFLQSCENLDRNGLVSLPIWSRVTESLETALNRAEGWLSSLDSLREWKDYREAVNGCRSLGLDQFVDVYEKQGQNTPLDDIFMKEILYALTERLYDVNENIRETAGYRFERLIQQYNQQMGLFREHSLDLIQYRVSRNIDTALHRPELQDELAILRRVIESNGKRMSLRMIFGKIPNLLRVLKPCMIVSPLSAAQYLDPEENSFDVLIFDEASQIETWKAIGLIGRCSQAIVAGDPKQMPPTDFFNIAVSDDQILPWEDDQESILKDCLAAGLPDYYLKWHYRSRSESLIAFSNRQYYESKLVTFPAVTERTSCVRMVFTGGTYERGGRMRNPIEARALTDYVKQQLLSGDQRSYGIVTFNKNQRDLIESLIEKEAQADASFREVLDRYPEDEGIFIRNLESVQGDERDVILFSVGYGPDEEGKITMAFGPLQNTGGWRRLNVAITRARDEMILFTSLHAKDMRISESTARGVRDFKELLAYAETGTLPPFSPDGEAEEQRTGSSSGQEESTSLKDSADPLIRRLAQTIEGKGYACDLNIGASGLKIDIGIYKEGDPRGYLLGIIVHTRSFCSNPSIYDREIGQLDKLRLRGWKLLQIWPLDWLEDHHREESRIWNALNEYNETEEYKGE